MHRKSRLHRSTLPRPVDESSYCASAEAHQTSPNALQPGHGYSSQLTDGVPAPRDCAAGGGAEFIVMTGRRWVTCRPAPRIISRRVSIRLFRAVAVWFFYRACVFMCTRRRSLFTDCSVRPSRLFILLLFLVFIHKVKVDRRELHYCTEVIERRAIC